MYLAPRTGVPHSNAGVFRDVTYRRVLVLLGRIALVIVHFGHSVVLCRAAKDSASLNSNSAIRRTLTRHRHKVKIFNLRKKKMKLLLLLLHHSTVKRTNCTRKQWRRRMCDWIPVYDSRDRIGRRRSDLL